MVIALVGKSCSGKYAVAHDIRRHMKGTIKRVKSYITSQDRRSGTHLYMPADDFANLPISEIVHSVCNEYGHIAFFLKSQFETNADMIYVIDDPVGLEKLRELDIQYAVIFVDSSDGKANASAKEFSSFPSSVIARLEDTKERMNTFSSSGEYSCYINTDKLSPSLRVSTIDLFCNRALRWKAKGEIGNMPYIGVGKCLRDAKTHGHGVVQI